MNDGDIKRIGDGVEIDIESNDWRRDARFSPIGAYLSVVPNGKS
jgi:hypothetical protein